MKGRGGSTSRAWMGGSQPGKGNNGSNRGAGGAFVICPHLGGHRKNTTGEQGEHLQHVPTWKDTEKAPKAKQTQGK